MGSRTAAPSGTRDLLRSYRISMVLEVPGGFRQSVTAVSPRGLSVSTGTIGTAGNSLNDRCLIRAVTSALSGCVNRRNIRRTSSLIIVRGECGPALSCHRLVVPTLVVVLLVLVYNFVSTVGVMARGRGNAVRRVGIAPINEFAFILTGLVPF